MVIRSISIFPAQHKIQKLLWWCLRALKVRCLILPGDFAWGKAGCSPGISRYLSASRRTDGEQVLKADQGICSGLQNSQCCVKELVMRSVCPPQRGFWSIKCCCRTPFYILWGWQCVFVFNFRLALVWFCRLSAPLLLKGVRILGQCSPTRNPISMLGGSYSTHWSTEGGKNRIPFKAHSCPELNETPAWGQPGGCQKTRSGGGDFDTNETHDFSKTNCQTAKKITPSKPPSNCMKAMTWGDLD